ncbi:MAG: glycogen-binding domain-containing protein [Candidatus Omnitrophota bacterium]|nr:glycogen-binding domain-containing protein [Candidatus Omnitrophota bacterium]
MPKTKTKKEVEFRYYAPDAKSVKLSGDFSNWDSQLLSAKKDKKGFWKLKLALTPGSYQYKFFVDGQWQNDPNCHSCVPNAFGSLNCKVDVK